MKKFTLLTLLVASVSFSLTTFAGENREVSCSTNNYSSEYSHLWVSNSDQCFIGQNVYLWYSITNLQDYLYNYSSNPNLKVVFFTNRSDAFRYDFKTLQNSTWYYSGEPLMQKVAGDNMSKSWEPYIYLNKWEKKLIAHSIGNSSIRLGDVSSSTNKDKPVAILTYTTKHHEFNNGSLSGPITHKEHTFYYASWCGDGVVDSRYGEKYDDGKNNGKPGFATTDCKNRVPDAPKPSNGVCSSNYNWIPTYEAPKWNLCTIGKSSIVVDKGDRFTWTCSGTDGGSNISCQAPKKQDAVCWPNNQTITITKPNTNLCLVGQPSVVSGSNVYSWTCNWINGGSNASCSTLPPNIENQKCDETFKQKLRYYGPNNIFSYSFSDKYSNPNSYPHTLKSFVVNFRETDDMNKDWKLTFDNFKWSIDNKTIPAGAENVRIISADPRYFLLTTPARRQQDNIYVEYIVNWKWKQDFSHKECISFEVTWCGDGVVDNYTDNSWKTIKEICDPNDPKKTNWGENGCNPQGAKDKEWNDISCTPKTNPNNPNIEIKKYVKNIDNVGDSQSEPVKVAKGESFNYYYVFENTENFAVNNVTLQDVFPSYLTFNWQIKVVDKNNVDVTNDFSFYQWKINVDEKSHITLKAVKKTSLVANSGKYIVTVPVKIDSDAPLNISLQNMVYICADGVVSKDSDWRDVCKPTIPGCETNPNDPRCLPTPPPTKCTPENNPYKDPACVIVTNDNNLTIKKFAWNKDGQNSSDALSVDLNKEFNYTYRVTLTGSVDKNNVTVTDKFPEGVIVTGFKTIPSGWTCKNGKVWNTDTVVCSTSKMTKNTTVDIVVNAKLSFAKDASPKRNIAYVCADNTPSNDIDGNVACTPKCVDPNNPSCVPPREPGICSDIPSSPNYDPACIVPSNLFDLSIKKYIDEYDAQTAIQKSQSSTFNYKINVKVESGKSIGTTTVKDVLPAGIEMTSNPQWENWTCSVNWRTVTCTSDLSLEAGKKFPTITIPVKITATSGSEVRNDATVYNPNEVNSCHNNNKEITGSEKSCEKDPKNTDPAIFRVPGWSNGGSNSYKTMICVDDLAVIKSYPNQNTCLDEWNSTSSNKRYSGGCLQSAGETDSLLNQERDSIQKVCKKTPTTPTGPGGSGGNPYCGDWIVNRIGEQCDLGSKNGKGWYCSATCKINNTTTNPGENPIEYSIQVPGLAKLGGTSYNKKFQEYGLIVGLNSKLFTIKDQVILGINQKYNTPIHIPTDELFTIRAEKGNIVAWSASKKLSEIVNDYPHWTSKKGNTFVVIGEWDVLIPTGSANIYGLTLQQAWSMYSRYSVNNVKKSIKLFNWSELSSIIGKSLGETGINLEFNDNSLASFTTQVINSRVASTTTVNRSLTAFTNFNNRVQKLTNKLKNNTSSTQNASNNNISSDLFADNFTNKISLNGVNQYNWKISSIDDLSKYKYNGNQNVFAIKWNISIENCNNNSFEMSGVKTLIVEGDITFKCNTSYHDNNSSWAFIAKGWNVIVDDSVTNLAWVFVSIKENNNGWKITQKNTTTNILRIDGTLYGDATELFNKRTYARASTSYEIITSGTVMTYSNRALRNPPPMLSNYLNSYKVQRVVR